MDFSPIPDEIKSSLKLFGNFYLIDLIVVIFYVVIMSVFNDLVNESVIIPYSVFNVLVSLFLVQSSPYDKTGTRKIYHLIYLSLTKDRNVYHKNYKQKGERESL